jgi:uncharacterized protein YgiM (DUF1202 family)
MNKLEELNELLKSGAINQIEYELIKKKLGIEIETTTKVEETVEAPTNEQVSEEPKAETTNEESKLTQKEIFSSDSNKKSNILKWVIIILAILGLGYFGANLYFQNQLLQSSLKQTEGLYQNELNANHEEILMEIDEEDSSDEDYWSLSHKTYANSNASNLNVRSTPALSDNIIDMLQLGDRVEVLDTVRIEIKTIKQALLNQETFIEIKGIEILFQKGKALEIVNKIGDNSYRVIVDERNNEAIISKKNLDLIDKEIWLKIRLNNQQEGYVYQRFLTREISDELDQVENNILHCENNEFIIKIDRLKNQDVRYISWNKPKMVTDKPNLVLYNGKVVRQGTGGGYHYIFKSGEWNYVIENNLMGESMGIFLKLLNNSKQKMYKKMTDLTTKENSDYYEVYNTYLDKEDYLNLRSEATSKSTNITRMTDGTKLILLSKGNGSNGKWMKVRVLESGEVGYAHTKWIRKINEE